MPPLSVQLKSLRAASRRSGRRGDWGVHHDLRQVSGSSGRGRRGHSGACHATHGPDRSRLTSAERAGRERATASWTATAGRDGVREDWATDCTTWRCLGRPASDRYRSTRPPPSCSFHCGSGSGSRSRGNTADVGDGCAARSVHR